MTTTKAPRNLPTKEEWATIIAELEQLFGHVELLIDGFAVTYCTVLVQRKLQIMTYVNGKFGGAWCEGTAPESRFLRPKIKKLFNTKERKALIKAWGGRRCPADKREQVNQTLTIYSPYWLTPTGLQRHLQRVAQNIAVVSIGCKPVTPAAVKEVFNHANDPI